MWIMMKKDHYESVVLGVFETDELAILSFPELYFKMINHPGYVGEYDVDSDDEYWYYSLEKFELNERVE